MLKKLYPKLGEYRSCFFIDFDNRMTEIMDDVSVMTVASESNSFGFKSNILLKDMPEQRYRDQWATPPRSPSYGIPQTNTCGLSAMEYQELHQKVIDIEDRVWRSFL